MVEKKTYSTVRIMVRSVSDRGLRAFSRPCDRAYRALKGRTRQRIADSLSGSGQARHHGADRDRENFCNFPVRSIFNIAKQDNFPEANWQLLDRVSNRLGTRAIDQQGFGAI